MDVSPRNDKKVQATRKTFVGHKDGNPVILQPDRVQFSIICDATEQAVNNLTRRAVHHMLDHLGARYRRVHFVVCKYSRSIGSNVLCGPKRRMGVQEGRRNSVCRTSDTSLMSAVLLDSLTPKTQCHCTVM